MWAGGAVEVEEMLCWRRSAGRICKKAAGNCNNISFTKLPWPGDNEGVFRSSSQAATCPIHSAKVSKYCSCLSLPNRCSGNKMVPNNP